MDGWIATIASILLALLGIWLGRWFSRLKRPWWLIGFLLPYLVVVLVGLTRYFYTLVFVWPFSWLTAGRLEFLLSAPVIALLLTTPLSRLSSRRLRVLVILFMVFAIFYFSLLPFALPIFLRHKQEHLHSDILEGGICLQSTAYNCGPAAAATALRQLGIEADEGELAILAYSNPISGTPEDLLCAAIQKHYRTEGIICERRPFKTLDELKEAGLTLAVIKYTLRVDHYVTVLEVYDDEVVVADPLVGKTWFTHKEFMAKWRRSGIVIKRKEK